MIKRLQAWFLPILVLCLAFMTACGNDNGNDDTIFTGFSGVVILVLIVWFFARRSRRG